MNVYDVKAVVFKDPDELAQALEAARIRAMEANAPRKGQPFSWYVRTLIRADVAQLKKEGKIR